MTKHSANVSARKINTLQIARQYLEMGIAPCPLRPQSKKPSGGPGWNTLRVGVDELSMFFREGENVGGLWGAPSGWLVDVDLDWDEATLAAPRLLPETFVYGRRSRPSSHYIYRCEGLETFKRVPFKDSIIVEVRSTGTQSVLPPSIHPDRERYEINHDIEFRSISRRELEKLVNRVASAALVARYYPSEGGRHDLIHALVGSLMHSGWKDEDVRTFVLATLEAVGDKETDISQRERTMENTIDHFKRGNRIAGWQTLSQWFTGEQVTILKKWLSFSSQYEAPPKIRLKKHNDEEPAIDLRLLTAPGLVGDIAKWASRRSYAIQPLFDIAVGLASVALLGANRYVVDSWETPLQPYFMLLAPTANGKDSALESIQTIAYRAGMGETVFQGFQSYHSLLDKLSEEPHLAMWLWDEAARKMKSAAKSQGGQDYQIITFLMSLYGKANSRVAGLPGRKQSIKAIERPYASVIAAAQPTSMIDAITDSDLTVGFINRFVLFDAGDELADSNLNRSTIFPSTLEERLKDFRLVDPPRGEYPFIKIRFDAAGTVAYFRDFNERCRELCTRGGGWEMWGRTNQNALMVAGIVAIGINPRKPLITDEVAKWACDLVQWASHRWAARVEECSSRSSIESASKGIERIVRNASTYVGRAKSKTEAALLRKGWMPRGMLTRLNRHLRGRDLDDAINQLVLGGIVGQSEEDGLEIYWIKNQ